MPSPWCRAPISAAFSNQDFHQNERPVVVFVHADGRVASIVPNLELASFALLGLDGEVFDWRDEEGYQGGLRCPRRPISDQATRGRRPAHAGVREPGHHRRLARNRDRRCRSGHRRGAPAQDRRRDRTAEEGPSACPKTRSKPHLGGAARDERNRDRGPPHRQPVRHRIREPGIPAHRGGGGELGPAPRLGACRLPRQAGRCVAVRFRRAFRRHDRRHHPHRLRRPLPR